MDHIVPFFYKQKGEVKTMNNTVWGVITFLIILGLIWLGVEAVLSIGWVIGLGLIPILILLLVLKVIDVTIGWGFIVGILIILFVLELLVW